MAQSIGKTILNGNTFTNNIAELNGGALYYPQAMNTSIYNSSFSSNQAISGAAMYIISGKQAATFIMANSTISSNTASITGTMYISVNSSLSQLVLHSNIW